jgi:hypothetical protein
VNAHLPFECRDHLELGADGDHAGDLEAQPERGNTCFPRVRYSPRTSVK